MKTLLTSKPTSALFSVAIATLLLLHKNSISTFAQDLTYTDCSIDDYYNTFNTNNLSSWTPAALEEQISLTHRSVIPYTHATRPDVWDALAQLDPGDGKDTVRLIYTQTSVDALVHGTATSWNREHLWPKSHGVFESGADFSDLHHLRPADWNVNAARNNLYFGACDTIDSDSACQSPAHTESTADTSKTSEIFIPPAVVRGDIARALFYMHVRYGESTNNDGTDLVLTDCLEGREEEVNKGYSGYLSVLLQWHAADPVSEEEKTRNELVCENWQGNRNPFVDFPDLVPMFFGEPQTPPYQCDNEATAVGPTTASPPAPAPVTTLSPGDVMIVGFHADNPDLVALVALADIPRGTRIVISDNAWDGTAFATNEGSHAWTVTSTVTAGTVFGYGDPWTSIAWSTADAGFNLAAGGEVIHVYATTNDDDDSIVHLSALSFNGEWSTDPTTLDTGSSILPASIADWSVILPHMDNYVYMGPTAGSKSSLQASLTNSDLWQGSNTDLTLASNLKAFAVTGTSAADQLPGAMLWSWNTLLFISQVMFIGGLL